MSTFRALRPGAVAAAAVLAATLAPAAEAHTVLPGESFWSIATANGVSPYALAAYSRILLPSLVRRVLSGGAGDAMLTATGADAQDREQS